MYDPKNAWALRLVQSAVFERFGTNFSQNDFDHLMYFHVALFYCCCCFLFKWLWIYESHTLYIWTADKDVNMKAIFTVMNTTWAIAKIRPEKKFRPVRDLNPWPLWHQSSALPTELMSQLRADRFVGSK